jgi:hypothetical protein
MRDSFEKLPPRGTLPLEPRGLHGGWYPMDYEEAEAIRRQNYFSDTIGSAPMKDRDADKKNYPPRSVSPPLHDSIMSNTVSSGGPIGRRESSHRHKSRQYQTRQESGTPGKKHGQPEDNFSDYKKWHPDHFADAPQNIRVSDEGAVSFASSFRSIKTLEIELNPNSPKNEDLNDPEKMRVLQEGLERELRENNTTIDDAHEPFDHEQDYVNMIMAEAYKSIAMPSHDTSHVASIASMASYGVQPEAMPDNGVDRRSSSVSQMLDDYIESEMAISASHTRATPDGDGNTKAGAEDVLNSSSPDVNRSIELVNNSVEKSKAVEDRVSMEEAQLAQYLSWLESQREGHVDS